MIPIYKVIITSIDAYSSYDFRWVPQKFSWGGYRAIVTRSNLYHPFLISVITTIVGTFVGLLVVTLGGYVLIQWEMPGRKSCCIRPDDPDIPAGSCRDLRPR